MTLWLSLVTGITISVYLAFLVLQRVRPQVVAPLVAGALSAQALVWLLLPRFETWAFPGWEALQFSFSHPAWLTGIALGLALSGMAWRHVAHDDAMWTAAPLLFMLPLLGLALLGAQPLTWLAFSALLDLVWLWGAVGARFSAQRLSGGLLLRGAALFLLWAGALPHAAQPGLWWGAAALLRLALYPLQVERRAGTPPWLALINPLLAALLLAHLPQALPMGMLVWVSLAALLSALRALLGADEERRTRVGEALLLAGLSASFAQLEPALPLLVVGAWAAAWMLLHGAYGWSRDAWPWVVPGAWGLAVLLGLPPAPLGFALWTGLAHSPWGVLLMLVLALPLACAAGVAELCRPLMAAPLAETRARQVAQGAALLLLVPGTVVGSLGLADVTLNALGLGVWAVALGLGLALAFGGSALSERLRADRRWELFTDAGMIGRWLGRVAQGLLRFVNFVAGVIEGDGALIWSLVFLFLIFVAGQM